jgi:hypothetical protein
MRSREHSLKLMAEAQRLTIGKRVGEREGKINGYRKRTLTDRRI